jgi:hypothetical protein
MSRAERIRMLRDHDPKASCAVLAAYTGDPVWYVRQVLARYRAARSHARHTMPRATKLERKRARWRAGRERRVSAGLCVRACGADAEHGRVKCADCLGDDAARHKGAV